MYTRKKNNKNWYVVKKNGREKWFPDREKALLYERNVMLLSPKTGIKTAFTVHEYSEYYLSRVQVRQKTKDAYKYALKSLCKACGTTLLSEL